MPRRDRLASVGELAAGVAHELNNPLTSVIGFSQLLLDKDIPDDAREDVAIIYKEAQRTAAIVKNLLTFGIPGSGFAEFMEKHFPCREWGLLTAESRPHEFELAKRLEVFTARGYETVVITDNMVGFCLLKKQVEAVFLYYRQIANDQAICQGGSLLIAVLAQEVGTSCSLFPTDFDPEAGSIPGDLSFAGDVIATGGVKSYVPLMDKVPMSYISKVW